MGERCLSTTGDHEVVPAATDQVHRRADGIDARRAVVHQTDHVGTGHFQQFRHRHRGCLQVAARDGRGRDAARTATVRLARGLLDRLHRAHRRTDDHPHPPSRQRLGRQPGIRQRLHGRYDRELCLPRHPPRPHPRRDQPVRIKVRDLGHDVQIHPAGVVARERLDATAPLQQGVPERPRSRPRRRDRPDARDHHAAEARGTLVLKMAPVRVTHKDCQMPPVIRKPTARALWGYGPSGTEIDVIPEFMPPRPAL